MLKTRILPIATCCLGLALLISSTGWFGKSASDDAKPEIESADTGGSSAAPESFLDEVSPPKPAAAKPAALRIGSRFPYLKTVEQRITQHLPDGAATGNTRLTIGLTLQVENIAGDDLSAPLTATEQPGDKLISVRYRNVKLTQDIPGQEVEFDSDNPGGPVPPQVEPYHGLPGNGFAFWLDARNQLRSLVGFPDFLQSCLQHATPQQRTLVWKSMAGVSEADHLANFLDDSIALLPGDLIQPGTSWNRERSIQQPIPVAMRLQYTIADVTETLVDVAVGGTVAPQAAIDVGTAQVQILGGRITGRCSVDRHTGLPQTSRIEQIVEMVVLLPGGESIPQTKQTITQLMATPESDVPPSAIPYAGREKDTRLR